MSYVMMLHACAYTCRLHERCGVLVAALANKEVSSREELLQVWEQEPLCEYSVWGKYALSLQLAVH